MAWGKKNPGELQKEIKELAASGFFPELIENPEIEISTTVNIQIKVLGTVKQGRIEYPDLFPWLRPALFVNDLGENLRHYNPKTGEICLLQSGSRFWQPNTTTADFIKKQLPKWEQSATRHFDDSRLEIEDHQAEPKSAYYQSSFQRVMIDTSWSIPENLDSGFLEVAFPSIGGTVAPNKTMNLWAVGVKDHNKNALFAIDDKLTTWISDLKPKVEHCPWVRVQSPPAIKNGQELREYLFQNCSEALATIENNIRKGKSGIYGLLFKEESPKKGMRDGWLYVAYYPARSKPRRLSKRKGQQKQKTKSGFISHLWLIGGEPAGETDFRERIPELFPLRDKVIAVVGLGCVGAPSALQFARAGVGEIRLLDGDFVSTSATCRWPLGFEVAGWGKVDVLSNFINKNFPFTHIGKNHYPPGSDGRMTLGQLTQGYDQSDCLERLFDGVNLIYDATAEEGINQLLANMAKAKNIPYICVSSRPGGWGGEVVRITSKTEGCFVCFLHELADESKESKIQKPPYDPKGEDLQPNGCGDITFTAASFDIEEISLAGVRMAISSLCDGQEGAYPQIDHDVGILKLRDNNRLIFPEWKHYSLPKHSSCENC